MSKSKTKGVIAVANSKSEIVELNFLPGMSDMDKVEMLHKLIDHAGQVLNGVTARLMSGDGNVVPLKLVG